VRRLVIITGLSGSGKSLAARCFEDMDFFCVDNLPVGLIPQFYELIQRSGESIARAAIVVDARERKFLEGFPETLSELRAKSAPVSLLFFECTDEILKRRFSGGPTRCSRPAARSRRRSGTSARCSPPCATRPTGSSTPAA